MCLPYQVVSTFSVIFIFCFDWAGGQGTTKYLTTIVVGRCNEFQQVISPTDSNRAKNCSLLAESFVQATKKTLPCQSKPENYNEYVDLSFNDLPTNSVLFWSGVGSFVNDYSSSVNRYLTVANTLTGFIPNGLRWCVGSGMEYNYAACPSGCDANSFSSVYAFWVSASIKFAKNANGVVYLMLNGSQDSAFSDKSTFARFELPNIDKSKVTLLKTLVIHQKNVGKRENCGEGSLKQLESKVVEKGLKFKCEDDPIEVLFYLCARRPSEYACPEYPISSANQHRPGVTALLLLSITLPIIRL